MPFLTALVPSERACREHVERRELVRPAILSGSLFAFVHSWDELIIVLFIAGRRVFTLPRRMWDGINDKLDPTLAAVAVLLMAASVALVVLDFFVRPDRRT